ncbi:hypothetical protein KP509_26G003700 [Ceratopteris richardii]|uniref:Uncharacterized protein n=1 Tax=Ceratopteris richardii TaxID=49495 RepID=A0A8T2RJX3_CERRI|nr:hypothetical protein KP509_26G003700 [Ceratopteris richardii]
MNVCIHPDVIFYLLVIMNDLNCSYTVTTSHCKPWGCKSLLYFIILYSNQCMIYWFIIISE